MKRREFISNTVLGAAGAVCGAVAVVSGRKLAYPAPREAMSTYVRSPAAQASHDWWRNQLDNQPDMIATTPDFMDAMNKAWRECVS